MIKSGLSVGTILCIDDQTYSLRSRIEWLRARKYRVIVVASQQAALETLITNPIAAAVLDCHMTDAFLLARLLRSIRPDLPIVILASYCGVPCHWRGLVTACLGRGEPPTALQHTLQKILKSEALGQSAA